jgi:hypothetical protein
VKIAVEWSKLEFYLSEEQRETPTTLPAPEALIRHDLTKTSSVLIQSFTSGHYHQQLFWRF